MVKMTAKIGILAYLCLVYLTYVLYAIGESDDNIRQAIQTRDVGLLENYVDFVSVRESLKQQIKSELFFKVTHNFKDSSQQSIGLREMSLVNDLVDDFVDLYVSDSGVEKLFYLDRNHVQSEDSGKADNIIKQLKSDKFINLEKGQFTSLTTVETQGHDRDGRAYKFIFSFRYLRWVLTDIRLDLEGISADDVVGVINQVKRSIN